MHLLDRRSAGRLPAAVVLLGAALTFACNGDSKPASSSAPQPPAPSATTASATQTTPATPATTPTVAAQPSTPAATPARTTTPATAAQPSTPAATTAAAVRTPSPAPPTTAPAAAAGRTRLTCQTGLDPANFTRTRIRAVLTTDDGRPVAGQRLTFDLPQPLFASDPNPGTAAGDRTFATDNAGTVGVAVSYPANTTVKVDGEAKVSFAGTAELAPSNCTIRLQVQVNTSS